MPRWSTATLLASLCPPALADRVSNPVFRLSLATLLLLSAAVLFAQAPGATTSTTAGTTGKDDLELVQKLNAARKDYQTSLEQLRYLYIRAGDTERARWAEDELRQYHRIPKFAFRLDLDVPPPTLTPQTNVPEANQLFIRAMSFKDKGWGVDNVDNQRRTEILLQELLSKYPTSNKIPDAAYMLGDVYEKPPYKMYRRAATYFERCFQWNPHTTYDARIRAARLYDRHTLDRARAMELYREVTTHTTDAKLLQEAQRRLGELGSK